MRRVVVVGAGFGGLAAARELAGRCELTLVDRHNYNTFQPLLYQVATAGLDPGDVAHTVRTLCREQRAVRVLEDRVDGVDLDTREVHLADGGALPYDALVLAAGARVSWFGVPGARQHAFALYTLIDAMRLRSHILECFESAERDPAYADDGALTFVVVGGGPTGVEMAGAMIELFHTVLARDFRRIDPACARVVVLEMGSSLLAPFRPRSRGRALDTLRTRGVEVRLGERVTAVEPSKVVLASGEVIPARTCVWTAGVQVHGLADRLGLAQDRSGRILVAHDLSVPGHPDVFVIGDLAAARGRDGALLPQLAPVAIQTGRHAGRQIARRLQGRPTRRFRYVDKGTMAAIGRRAAVADLRFGLSLTGTVAWLAWLFLHLLYLISFRRRFQVLVSWAWSYLAWDWGPRLVTPVGREG